MDFAELSDALGAPQSHGQWVYLSAVIVSVCEVVTGSPLLAPKDLTDLVAHVATSNGLDLLTPSVMRACVRKILDERFMPLARALRDAFASEPLEFEDGVADDLFDPIAQETVTCGFRINSAGSTVLSLSNLVRWVLLSGMRDPASHAALVSIDRVRCSGVPFPPTDPAFLEHVRLADTVLHPCLASVAVSDSIAAAHASINVILDEWAHSFAQRAYILYHLGQFLSFWAVSEEPPLFTALMQQAANVVPPVHIAVPVPAGGGFPAGVLHIEIPPLNLIDLFNAVADDEGDEGDEGQEEQDSADEALLVE